MQTVLSKRRRELKEARRQVALRKIDSAAAVLYREGAEAVYAFGSVLKPSQFGEHSDVDLAVKGISESKRHRVFTLIEEIFDGMRFDLLFLEEELRSEVRERILKEGVQWKP